MNLSDLKKRMIDLRRSEYDKERSSPKDGKYFWSKKVYFRPDDNLDAKTRMNFKYRWVAYDSNNDFAQFNHWRMNFDATPVDYKEPSTEVYPEPLVPNVEGHYRYMDMILMKIPLDVEVNRQLDNRDRYDRAREGLDKKFQSEVAAVDETAVEGTIKL